MDIIALIKLYPQVSIVIFSLLATMFVTAINYFITDRELMRGIKEKQKKLREEMKLYKNDPQKMMELNKQMMADFPHQMKQSLKTSVITIVPMLLLFNWLKGIYLDTSLATSWIWWYIVASLVFSMGLRKILKLD